MRILNKHIGIVFVLFLLFSCGKDEYEIEYANGNPNPMAGNWVVWEFPKGEIGEQIYPPYSMTTALLPNNENYLVLDNLYNVKLRIKAEIRGDTGIYAYKTDQLEVINKGGFGVEKVTIDGYIQENFVLKDFLFRLALFSFPDMSFSIDDIDEVIFFRAGYYDEYDALVDSVMVMGYRKTGFEDVDYD